MDPNISKKMLGEIESEGALIGLFSLGFPRAFWVGANTSNTRSQKIKAGKPSSLAPASKDMTSASVVECETAPCFLQNQLIGTKVLGPIRQRTQPEVDLESSKSPAKLASQKRDKEQSSGLSPT